MLKRRHIVRGIAFLLGGAAFIVVFFASPFEGNNWRQGVSREMFSVARVQVAIEQQLKSKTAVVPARLFLNRDVIADGYVLQDGVIVLVGPNNRFVLLFEPRLDSPGEVEWVCHAIPDSFFARLGTTLQKENCGSRYRDAIRSDSKRD